MDFATPITISRHSSAEDRQLALYQIYQQVLERQPYDSERKILAKAEKDFLSEKIGVKRFLKELGHSDVYLNAFYHTASNIQFLEGCFKHFLGRMPLNSEEIRFYCNILTGRGVAEMITTLLDSEEYRKVFGCFTVPYLRLQGRYTPPSTYLRLYLLNHNRMSAQSTDAVQPTCLQQMSIEKYAAARCHPEAGEPIESTMTENEVAKPLKLLESEHTASQLSPKQEALLRRAMR